MYFSASCLRRCKARFVCANVTAPRCALTGRTSLLARSTRLRFASHSAPRPPLKSGYPERLLIYHAGTGKTVIIGCVKLTTVFVFAFSCLVVGPRFYYAEDRPSWLTPLVVLGGAIPLLVVTAAYGPFVSYIHLRLPARARTSYQNLLHYVRTLPPHAELDITTLRLLNPSPKVTRLEVSELKLRKQGFGIANLERILPNHVIEQKRPWYADRAVTKFYVGEGEGERRSRAPGIWKEVLKAIQKQHGRTI